MSDEGSASVVSRYLRGIDAEGAAMGDLGVLKPNASNLYSVAAELLKHKGARVAVMDILKIIPAATDQMATDALNWALARQRVIKFQDQMARDQSDPETNGGNRDE